MIVSRPRFSAYVVLDTPPIDLNVVRQPDSQQLLDFSIELGFMDISCKLISFSMDLLVISAGRVSFVPSVPKSRLVWGPHTPYASVLINTKLSLCNWMLLG